MKHVNDQHISALWEKIQAWAQELGIQQVGVADADTSDEKARLEHWLEQKYQGSMTWIEEHKDLRLNPEALVPNATRIISARMDYLAPDTDPIHILKSEDKAYVARYALGRDYHKLFRKRLAKLAAKIEAFSLENDLLSEINQRPFVDSAPVLERPIAEKAGLGWVGKHTLLIHPNAGSWFFLGEIYTNIPLPVSTTQIPNQCGDCQACLQVCPTQAFPQPYVLDARRCISYLTIENKGPIPEEFREVMGNRIFGCDDCQAICPWNKYAQHTLESDFHPRHQLDNSDLVRLFNWEEQEFLDNTAGSPIRRIGYLGWLRNLAIGLGNAPKTAHIDSALQKRQNSSIAMENSWLKEHFEWALARQREPTRRRKRKLR